MGISELKIFVSRYRDFILTAVGLVVLFLLVAWLFQTINDYVSDSEIKKDKQAVNSLLQEANTEKGTLSNLAINEALKEAEVNAARERLAKDKQATDDARETTNQSLKSVEAIQTKDYKGKTLTEANTARCKAFPERCNK